MTWNINDDVEIVGNESSTLCGTIIGFFTKSTDNVLAIVKLDSKDSFWSEKRHTYVSHLLIHTDNLLKKFKEDGEYV